MKVDVPTAIILGAVVIAVAILVTQQPAEASSQPIVNIQIAAPTYTFLRDANGLWQMNGATGEAKLMQM